MAGAGRWTNAKEWKREPCRQARRLAEGAPGASRQNVGESQGRQAQSQSRQARDGVQVDQLVPARRSIDRDQPASLRPRRRVRPHSLAALRRGGEGARSSVSALKCHRAQVSSRSSAVRHPGQRHPQCLQNQDGVEQQHHRRADDAGDPGQAAIDELAHDVAPPGERKQRDHGQRQRNA